MLEKYPYISTEWLLFGKGNMYKEARMQTLFDFPQEDVSQVEKTKPAEVTRPPLSTQDVKEQEVKSENPDRKSISRIIWFYDDNSFEEYFPR
jgi:hypothetical protein